MDNGKSGNPLVSSLFSPDFAEAPAEVLFNSLLSSAAKDSLGSFARCFSAVGGNMRYCICLTFRARHGGYHCHEGYPRRGEDATAICDYAQSLASAVAELWDLASIVSPHWFMVTVKTFVASRLWPSFSYCSDCCWRGRPVAACFVHGAAQRGVVLVKLHLHQ